MRVADCLMNLRIIRAATTDFTMVDSRENTICPLMESTLNMTSLVLRKPSRTAMIRRVNAAVQRLFVKLDTGCTGQ